MSDISNKHDCSADSPQHDVLQQQIEVSSSYINKYIHTHIYVYIYVISDV